MKNQNSKNIKSLIYQDLKGIKKIFFYKNTFSTILIWSKHQLSIKKQYILKIFEEYLKKSLFSNDYTTKRSSRKRI
jgi:hypothetical protein